MSVIPFFVHEEEMLNYYNSPLIESNIQECNKPEYYYQESYKTLFQIAKENENKDIYLHLKNIKKTFSHTINIKKKDINIYIHDILINNSIETEQFLNLNKVIYDVDFSLGYFLEKSLLENKITLPNDIIYDKLKLLLVFDSNNFNQSPKKYINEYLETSIYKCNFCDNPIIQKFDDLVLKSYKMTIEPTEILINNNIKIYYIVHIDEYYINDKLLLKTIYFEISENKESFLEYYFDENNKLIAKFSDEELFIYI